MATFDRGDLNVGKTAISGTPVREEDWNLDMTGNWLGYVQKTSGTTDLDQDRTHNEVNEIADISETTGTSWATPVHDRAGNMTSMPKPASLASSLTLKWDAWNRLVEAKDGATAIGVYEYDPLNRRVKRHVDSQAPGNPNGIDAYIHYFYNSAWQVLETRETTTESDQPESLQPNWQYVWSLRYIDAPVLRDRNTDVDGLCDDERLYYLNDANFNVSTLVDTSGDAVERYLYEAYGKVTIYDGAWGSTRSVSTCGNAVRYTGREWDGETGALAYRMRGYGATLGLFLSRDPIGPEAGPNLYRYVNADPINNRDSHGPFVGEALALSLATYYYQRCSQGKPWVNQLFYWMWIPGSALSGTPEMKAFVSSALASPNRSVCGGRPGTSNVSIPPTNVTFKSVVLGAILGTGTVTGSGKGTKSPDKNCPGCFHYSVSVKLTYTDEIDWKSWTELKNSGYFDSESGIATKILGIFEALQSLSCDSVMHANFWISGSWNVTTSGCCGCALAAC